MRLVKLITGNGIKETISLQVNAIRNKDWSVLCLAIGKLNKLSYLAIVRQQISEPEATIILSAERMSATFCSQWRSLIITNISFTISLSSKIYLMEFL